MATKAALYNPQTVPPGETWRAALRVIVYTATSPPIRAMRETLRSNLQFYQREYVISAL